MVGVLADADQMVGVLANRKRGGLANIFMVGWFGKKMWVSWHPSWHPLTKWWVSWPMSWPMPHRNVGVLATLGVLATSWQQLPDPSERGCPGNNRKAAGAAFLVVWETGVQKLRPIQKLKRLEEGKSSKLVRLDQVQLRSRPMKFMLIPNP